MPPKQMAEKHDAEELRLTTLTTLVNTAALISRGDSKVHVINVDGRKDVNVLLHRRIVLLSVSYIRAPGNPHLIKGFCYRNQA